VGKILELITAYEKETHIYEKMLVNETFLWFAFDILTALQVARVLGVD